MYFLEGIAFFKSNEIIAVEGISFREADSRKLKKNEPNVTYGPWANARR